MHLSPKALTLITQEKSTVSQETVDMNGWTGARSWVFLPSIKGLSFLCALGKCRSPKVVIAPVGFSPEGAGVLADLLSL